VTFNPKEIRVPKGQPGGGRWGSPRNSSAAKAQGNSKAMKSADDFAKLPANKRTAYLKGLSDADLEALTEVVYSHRTSDPAVVAMRITVANEMTKRGLDIKKFGALGGGLAVGRKSAPVSVHIARTVAKKAAAAKGSSSASAVRAARTARATSQVRSTFSNRAV